MRQNHEGQSRAGRAVGVFWMAVLSRVQTFVHRGRLGVGRFAGIVAVLWFGALSAHAVVVRGKVTDPLGAAVVNASVQLVQGTRMIAITHSGVDGSFEIRSTAPGRFRLLTIAP